MYKTKKISVYELVYRMRNMQAGDEIGLSQTEDGEYSYGIRCLPGAMFDNGMCWLADYYGGGCVTAFSETEQQFMEDTGILLDEVRGWLVEQNLVDQDFDCVNVQIKDGTLPETKWEFKKETIEPKNRMVCMKFYTYKLNAVYISIPPSMSDAEACGLTKEKLAELDEETYRRVVISHDDDPWDPWPEDFENMEVDPCCNQQSADVTDKPTGTLGR